VPFFLPVGSDLSPGQTAAVFIMDPLSLFTLALGLPTPWEVIDVAFDPQSGRIDFHRAFAPGTRCSCPQCGAERPPVHDTLECDWRHLNCFQFQASIHAKVPRVRCGTCARTTQVVVPWARPNSGFSLRMEVLLVTLCKTMAVSQVTQIAWRQRRARLARPRSLRRSGTRSGGLLDRHLGWSRRDRLTARTQ